jgi:hypothetical protein
MQKTIERVGPVVRSVATTTVNSDGAVPPSAIYFNGGYVLFDSGYVQFAGV